MTIKETIAKEAAAACRKAAEILRTRGWIQGNFKSDKGFCMIGALRLASGGKETPETVLPPPIDENDRPFLEARRAIEKTIYAMYTHDFDPPMIPEWNDRNGQDRETVIECLEVTAEQLESNLRLSSETLVVY